MSFLYSSSFMIRTSLSFISASQLVLSSLHWRRVAADGVEMMRLTSTLHVILFVLFITSSAVARRARWLASEPTSDDELLDIIVLIKQQNVDILKERLVNVSDPSHIHYGQYWTIQQMHDLTKPHAHHHRSVTDWLTAHDVLSGAVVYSDAIRVKVRADTASRMFNASFRQYQHRDTASVIHRIDAPNNVFIPPNVADAVDAFLGVYDFPTVRPRRNLKIDDIDSRDLGNASTSRVFLPYTMVNMYGLPATSSSATTSQGVIAFGGADGQSVASFSQADLYVYANTLDLGRRTVDNIIGNNDQRYISEESNLDVQMITGVNGGASTYFYMIDSADWIYSAILEIINTGGSNNIPQVISISYSAEEYYEDESELQQYNIYNYQVYIERTDIELIKLNLKGTTILVSSGDDGANFADEECCYSGEYDQYHKTGFIGSYPATSPYVLTVGATDIPLSLQESNFNLRYPIVSCESGLTCVSGPAGSEVAVSTTETSYTSGGGFSAVEPVPYWQYNFIETYLSRASELPPASYWNASNRGYPDVSALGGPMFIIVNNNITHAAGTSASTPIFAALIARLNDVQLSLRGHTLGFINPLFYQMVTNNAFHTFNDIISGDNICPQKQSNPSCTGFCGGGQCVGFVTTPGWDPVTGLGTPNYTEMVRYISQFTYTSNLTYNSQTHRYDKTGSISGITLRMSLCVIVVAVSLLLTL